MHRYAPLEMLSAAPALPLAPPAAPDFRPIPELLSFVVDLDDLGIQEFHQAREIQVASACPIYAFSGPEYVNPRSGAREVAGWIL